MPSAIQKHRKVLLEALLAIAIIAVLIYRLISPPSSDQASASASSSAALDSGKEMPDAMKELAQNQSVEWMAGMWVELPQLEMTQSDAAPNVDVYASAEGVIQATVTLQNGLDRAQPYYLMVFADGIPAEYNIGKNTYQTYPVELTPQQTILKLELQPDFSLNLGRLDFLLFYDGNSKSDFHMTSYTVWLRQSGEEKISTDLQNTVEQRKCLEDSFTSGSYGAWLWNWDSRPTPTDQIGPQEITAGEKFLLEAIASDPGLYRTVLMLDGRPISFILDGTVRAWLDWTSSGTDMLQVPIELTGDCTASGSFFTVTTPLGAEAMSLSNLASVKIQVLES